MPTTLRNAAPRILLAAVLPVVSAAIARAAVPPEDAALADRIESLASISFPAKVPTGNDRPFVFAQQAALFEAAARLDPETIRYVRKRAEALADSDADAKEQGLALTAILALQPGDEFTWNKLVDLHVDNDFQAKANLQIDYLKKLESLPTLPRAVIAHAGARHARILLDQGKDNAARTLLKSVLTNNPLDLDGLRLQYRLLPPKATPFEREQALLNILRANPMQPPYARLAALVAADAGLVQEALSFFSMGVNTSVAMRRPDLQGAIEWFAELYLAEQRVDAYRNVQGLLQGNPNNIDAWYLDLLVVRSSGFQQAQVDKDLQRATVVMSDRVAELINAAIDVGKKPGAGAATQPARATTRPFDAEGPFPLPDLTPVAALLKGDDFPPRLRQEFVEAVADLARLKIYFAHKPDEAKPLLDALAQLQPAGDPLLAQLQGLSALIAGDAKSALTLLAGVVKDDPISAMGLILAQQKDDPANAQQTDLESRKLIQDHPDGLIGAFLIEALSNPRVKLVPKNGTQQVQQLIQSFPHDLFNLGTSPDRLYSIHVAAVDTSRAWGQPLLAQVTLFNFSPVDLTLGDDGAIHPGLLFQMNPIIGAQNAAYPAFDTFGGPVVLHPRIPLTQVVRVDQGGLITLLDKTVRLAFQVDGRVATNTDVGLGGYVAHFDKPFARTAVNPKAVADACNDVNGDGMNPAAPADRLTAVGVLQAFVAEALSAKPPLPPAVAQDVANGAAAIRRACSDASPSVSAWAEEALFATSDQGARVNVLNDLAASADWRRRMLCLVLSNAVPGPAVQGRLAEQLQSDKDPSVAAYAKASVELMKLGKLRPIPASQPIAQPGPGAGAPHP